MGDSWLWAVGLVLCLEGLLPLLSPGAWREAMTRALQLKDGQLRFLGLAAVVAGGLLIAFASG